VRDLGDFLRHTGLRHSCRVVLVAEHLTDPEMVDLLRATTFYVTATRAAGAGLVLRDALAAGRPAVAPRHTGLADCFDDGLGWVVASSPEPAPFPGDPGGRLRTTWHRLDWRSLCEGLRDSYEVARCRQDRYRELARRGRERLRAQAGCEQVLPRLRDALAGVAGAPA
jgi:glycosyltransferase involved in cell wall biosynthesis